MIAGLKTAAKRAVSSVRRTLNHAPSSRPVILMYHRIATTRHDPWHLTVSPENLAEQLDVIKRTRRVLSLRRFFERLRSNTLPQGAIAITFDDGYADNFHVAAPILRKYDAPATLFITTGYLDRPEFWWDELSRLLSLPSALPSVIMNGQPKRFRKSQPLSWLAAAGWHARQNGPRFRGKLIRDMWQQMREGSAEFREAVLQQLRSVCASDQAEPPFEHRPMTKEEVTVFSRDELIEIGAHSQSHPKLSVQPSLTQHLEITGSKKFCEELTGREVISFSYPFGDRVDQTMRLASDAGFQLACTSRFAAVRSTDSCFDLPRLWVSNWNGDELNAKLREYS